MNINKEPFESKHQIQKWSNWFDLLIVLGICEADEWQVIASKGFGDGKILFGRVIVVDVVKVARVVVAAEVRHDRRHAIADRVKCPLVVDEEFVAFDLGDPAAPEPLSSDGTKNKQKCPGTRPSVGVLSVVWYRHSTCPSGRSRSNSWRLR